MTDWMERALEALEARPCRHKPGFWQAKCPAHEDRLPSLRAWVGRKGQLMFGCYAGCPKLAILSACGLRWADVWPPRDSQQRRVGAVGKKAVGVYDYTDEGGRLLYQSVRYVPKDFRYRQPVKSDWVWNLDGVRLVPFRLHRLCHYALYARPVLIVEGEKDVEALEARGFLATTNCGGTAMGWLDSYSWTLAGRRVVLLPDNDAAGRKHMDCVAGSLLRNGVGSVRLVHLPGLKERGDASDWFQAGNGASDLEAVVTQAREYR